MERSELERLVGEGLTLSEIGEVLGVSREVARRRVRAAGLETAFMARRRALQEARAEGTRRAELSCLRHGLTEFVLRPGGEGFRCVLCRSEDVTKSRRRRKEQLVREAGGRCQICGYDRYVGALQFHHVDRTTKRFGMSHRGIPRGLDVAREEARRCVLLCGNCHAEVEAGIHELPNMKAAAADR
jgi:hypothetical protein